MVYSAQSDQKLQKTSKEFKKGEKIIDTNAYFILYQKADKFCVEEIGKPGSKKTSTEEKSTCVPSTHSEYLYPSGQGFWFVDRKQDKLIHVSTKEVSSITIASKDFQILSYRGITNNIGISEAGSVDLYSLKDSGIQRGDTIEKTCSSDSNALFTSEANPLYWGLTCHRTGKDVGELDIEVIEVAGGKVKQAVAANTFTSQSPIGHIWVCKSVGKSHPLLVAYKDGQYSQYNERGNHQWSRVPELENAIDVLAPEFPSADESEEIPVYESFGNNIVGALLYRVVSDFKNLVSWGTTILPRLTNINFQALINKISGKYSSEISDYNYYNKYGLRKNLVFVTKHNKLISVNSMNGQTLWSVTLKPSQKIEKAMVNADNNIDLIYSENGKKKRSVVSSLDGTFITKEVQIDGNANTFFEDVDNRDTLEAGFKANYLKNAKTDYSFYRVIKDQGVFGYRWNAATQKYEETWNFIIEASQSILEYSYHLKGHNEYLHRAASGSLSALPEDDALYYKVVDSGNIALLIKQTVNGKESLSVVIINTLRGKVLASYLNDAVDFKYPLGFIYDDNGVYISYMNSRIVSFELWSIELMATRVETSFWEMIQIYVVRIKKKDDLDYHADKPQFIVLDKKYGLPFGLKYLGAVSTRHGLTKRNLIGITTTNDVGSADSRSSRSTECWSPPEETVSRASRSRRARKVDSTTTPWCTLHTSTSCQSRLWPFLTQSGDSVPSTR